MKSVMATVLTLCICWFTPAALGADGFPQDQQARQLVRQGGDLLQAKNYQQAKSVLEQAVAIEPSNGLAHFRLARAYSELGDPGRALQEYFQAIDKPPHIPVTAYNIADTYQSLGQLKEAIKWMQRYIREEPDDSLVPMAKSRIAALNKAAGTFKGNADSADYFDDLFAKKGPERWPVEGMPVKVFIEGAHNHKGMPAEYPEILYEAFNEWIQATGGRLAIEVVPYPAQAALTCDWTYDPMAVKQGATGVEGGHTDVQWQTSQQDPSHTRQLYKVHVRILVIDNATGKLLDRTTMKKLCLHEVGHALGMDGHSVNYHDIMFFGESAAVSPTLTERDKATVHRLYNQ